MYLHTYSISIRNLWLGLAGALLVAAAWIVTFRINSLLFTEWGHSTYVNYIFLPAGVRLLSILLLEEIAVLGLLIGAIYTCIIYHPDISIMTCVGISLISAIESPLVY